jgi:hypothetical protein
VTFSDKCLCFLALCGTNHEDAAGGFDNLGGNYGQLVDTDHALGLYKNSLQQPKITAGCSRDSRYGLSVRKVSCVEPEAQVAPVAS